MKQLYLDVETTGLVPPVAGLIQIAGIIELGDNCEPFNFLCRPFPGDAITQEALDTNKRTREEILEWPEPREVRARLETMLSKYVDRFDKTDKFHVIAYNAQFDMEHLRAWWGKCGDTYFGSWFWHPPLCVMQYAAWALQSVRHTMPNFKLATVAATLGIEADADNTHEALYDVQLMRRVMNKLTKTAPILF